MKPIIAAIVLLIISGPAVAVTVDISWEPVTLDMEGKPETISHYVLYFGTSARPAGVSSPSDQSFSYQGSENVGNVVKIQRGDLLGGRTYYFSVSAVDINGHVSNYSDEVSIVTPADGDGGRAQGIAPAATVLSAGYQQIFGTMLFWDNAGDIEADYATARNTYEADLGTNSIGSNTANNGYNCEREGDYGVEFKSRIKAEGFGDISAGSGGEKSLIAIALILALQRFNPAPVYILDEVDTFLDATNTELVSRLFYDASRRSQFVLLTPAKSTHLLKNADKILGVVSPNGTEPSVIIDLR